MREAATIISRPVQVVNLGSGRLLASRCYVVTRTANQSVKIFDLLTSKVVFESCVTWATSVPILVFLGLSVLDLDPTYATDRRQTLSDVRRASLLNNQVGMFYI